MPFFFGGLTCSFVRVVKVSPINETREIVFYNIFSFCQTGLYDLTPPKLAAMPIHNIKKFFAPVFCFPKPCSICN
jgi:hypothetical protein